MGMVGKTNYSDEYESSNTWQSFPILNFLVAILYIAALIALALGSRSGYQLSERMWNNSAKFTAFIGPFLIGLVSAVACVFFAEIIKLFLHIQRNTYDTALYTYVSGMVLQDLEKRISIILNQSTFEKEQKSKSFIPESDQNPDLMTDEENVSASSGDPD